MSRKSSVPDEFFATPDDKEWELFASCAPGLEPLLREEAKRVQLKRVRLAQGGVRFVGNARDIVRANVELGLASHVLLRVARFNARSFRELEGLSRRAELPRWLGDQGAKVRAVSAKSKLQHTGAIEERVARGLTTAEPALPILVRVRHDVVTISIDTSGEPLHRRGYRLKGTKAPLREDLSRALVVASGVKSDEALLDPMCGAGTIPIEAAMLRTRTAPGLLRSFACVGTPWCPESLLDRQKELSRSRVLPASATVYARDRDDGAVAATLANAETAGVELDVRGGPLSSSASLVDVAHIVTDPPHGGRLGGRDLRPLYISLGRLRDDLGAELTLLGPDLRLVRAIGAPLSAVLRTDRGGIGVRFYSTCATPPDV